MSKSEKLMVTRKKKVWVYVNRASGKFAAVYDYAYKPIDENRRYAATVTWEEPAKCENCGKPAHRFVGEDMVPYCNKCATACAERAARAKH